MRISFLRATLAAALTLAAPLAAKAAEDGVIHLPSTLETVVRGVISAERAPVLRIAPGATVRIDTISHGGLTEDPVAFFAQAGIPPDQVLDEVVALGRLSREAGFAGHVLTGPIYVEGAEPGDMLEVRIRKVESRVPYGVNNPGPGGVAPTLVAERHNRIIKFDMERKVALVVPGKVEIPLAPFMGIMAVAPRPELKSVGSRMPGEFGGNLDFKSLVDGATLYLPVYNPGALFYTGDAHATQGDGEVSGNAIEASNTATLQFILHKGAGAAMRFPWAEDADYLYPLGLHEDLDTAYRYAVEEAVKMLQGKGLTAAEAYSFASVGIDFGVAEAVDGVLAAYGAIPKKALLLENAGYWAVDESAAR